MHCSGECAPQAGEFLLHLSIANGFVSSKIYDKRDDFDFDIVNFPSWMVTFIAVLRMAYTFRNLLGLLGLQSCSGLQRAK